MSTQAAADGQAGPAEGACVVMQEGVNAAGGAGVHTLHCGAWGGGEGGSPWMDKWTNIGQRWRQMVERIWDV